jgi:hypothetical protein
MTRTRASLAGSARAQQRRTSSRSTSPRLFYLDGGHIVFAQAAMAHGADAFAAVAAEWPDGHVTAITAAPEGASESMLADLGRAAQAFDRVVVCSSSVHAADSAARFARAVRAAGRTECQVAADAHRALRHCIDRMIRGDVIAYCCEDVESAGRILAEYGAMPVGDGQRTPATGTHVAPNGTAGEPTAAHV